MAVAPSTDKLGDIKTSLDLLTGVLITALEDNDMVTYERTHGVIGQLATLYEWAFTQQTPPPA